MNKKMALLLLLIPVVLVAGCVGQSGQPAAGAGGGEQIQTQQQAADAAVDIGSSVQEVSQALEGIDQSLGG